MSTKSSASYIGQKVTIKAGSTVTRAGTRTRRQADTTVTVRDQKPARNGKTRVFWKSNGYSANALI